LPALNTEYITLVHACRTESHFTAEMSTDRTETNFGRVGTGSDGNYFENWRIRTGSDRENFCCFNVIIPTISNISGV